MLQNFRINYEGYTKKEIEADILARKVQDRVGHPSDDDFKDMVREKLFGNFPVKLEHITNANNIFVANVSGTRRTFVRTKLTWVEREYISIPRNFHVLHKFGTLTEDVMFINCLPCLITLSR